MSFGETESSMSLPSREDSAPPPKVSVRPPPGLIAGTWHRPLFLMRDRWFESGSLQRGVRCEPDFGGESHGISPTPTQRRFSARNDLVILDVDARATTAAMLCPSCPVGLGRPSSCRSSVPPQRDGK